VVKDHHVRFPATLVGLEAIVQVLGEVLQSRLAQPRKAFRPAATSGEVVKAPLPERMSTRMLPFQNRWGLEPRLDRDVGRRAFRPQIQGNVFFHAPREQLVHPVVARHPVDEQQRPDHFGRQAVVGTEQDPAQLVIVDRGRVVPRPVESTAFEVGPEQRQELQQP
jgi:hypothetical protein